MIKANSRTQALNPAASLGVRMMQVIAGIALAVMLFSGYIGVNSSPASASYELSTTCRLISGGLKYTYGRAIDAINTADGQATDFWVDAHLRLSLLGDANGCNLDSDGSILSTR
ncbi:hypothetical protein BH09CHL1_BH09CHL1_09600 [soil metagenome]